MAIDTLIEEWQAYTDEILVEYEDAIIENSNEEALLLFLLFLTKDRQREVAKRYAELIDSMADDIRKEVNTDLGENNKTSTLTAEDLAEHKSVGAFYAIEGLRSGFRHIHSANIALQIPEDEREEAVEQAKEDAKSIATQAAIITLAFSYGVLTKLENERRDVEGYTWVTRGDDRVRPTHASNEGKYFRWDSPPATTGHPGYDWGCRCKATSVRDPQAMNDLFKEALDMSVKQVSSKTRTRPKAAAAVCNAAQALSNAGEKFDKNVKAYVNPENPNHAYVYISGVIGDDWDINTTDWQIAELNGITTSTTEIDVFINSPGGSMAHGVAIYNFLMFHKAKVRTYNMGDASSAASIIFLAGEERYMPIGTTSLIHDPWSCACFNRHDLESLADYMNFSSERMIDIYALYLNIDRDQIAEIMKNETVLESNTAIEMGFATDINIPVVTSEIIDATASSSNTLEAREISSTINAMAIRHLQTAPDNKGGNTTEGSSGMSDLATLQAKYALLEKDLADAKAKVTELEAQAATQESEEVITARIREQLTNEMAEMNAVRETLFQLNIETDSKATSPVALMRDVLGGLGVTNAHDTAAMPDTAIKSTFEWYASRNTTDSGEQVVGKVAASSSKNKDADVSPFSGMKKV